MSFAFEGQPLPKHWYADSPSLTHFFNALSAVFPDGELYFIESVRAFEHAVEHPRLQQQVREFTRQEGHHTHHHRHFNRLVAARGVSMERCAGIAKTILSRSQTHDSPLMQLAMTAAFEHFTALMGDWLLRQSNPGSDIKHCGAASLWSWHAVEETEHKAVAFDVYTAAGGDYWTRIRAMVRVAGIFIPRIHQMQLILLSEDESPLRLRDLLFCARYLYGRGGFIRSMIPGFFRYFRRDFHPWQDDNSQLISAWQISHMAQSLPPAA
jgi:predicted metal-dependent hydrolase